MRVMESASLFSGKARLLAGFSFHLQAVGLVDLLGLVAFRRQFGVVLSGFFLEELLQFLLAIHGVLPGLKVGG